MKRGFPLFLALSLVVGLVISAALYGQVKKDEQSGLDRIEGTIQAIQKDKSTIKIRQIGGAASVWTVVYSAQTKFTFRNEPSSVDQLKDGVRVIVLGKYADEVMTAARIDVRTEK